MSRRSCDTPILYYLHSPEAVIRLFTSITAYVSDSSMKSLATDIRSRQGRQHPEQHKINDYIDIELKKKKDPV